MTESEQVHWNETCDTEEGENQEQSLVIRAYEEVPPIVKTREEVIAEELDALRHYSAMSSAALENDATGGTNYLQMCERQHRDGYMKFPTACVASELALDKEVLDLSHVGLGLQGCVALAEALRVNSTVTSLILVANNITAEAAGELVKAILPSHTINAVDLSVNPLCSAHVVASSESSATRGGAVIAQLVEPSVSVLLSLRLRDTKITDVDVALFADLLSENTSLQLLDLSYNKIGYLGAVDLARMLSHNSDLRELNLEWNEFGTAGCVHILKEGLLMNNTIKTFNLSNCGLDDVCAQLLAQIMSENAIEEIIVANNRVGPVGAEAIARGLQTTSALTTLVVDGNPLRDAGCIRILNTVINGECKTLGMLSMLHCQCGAVTKQRGCDASSPQLVIKMTSHCHQSR